MAFELVYTSVPKGIRSGSSGFCIAAYTNGMAANLAVQLESLSAYKPFFPHYDPNASKNPVAYSHYSVSCSGNLYHVVSRVCFAGLDYTKRSNKLAHHLALAAADVAMAPDGPTAVFRQNGLFLEKWDAPPQLFPKQKNIHAPHLQLHPANLWKQYVGDAGWAGTLVQRWLEKPDRPVFIIFDPLIHTDILGLVEEALLLLPENRRWEVSFNTYFTALPAGIRCSWRFCTAGSDVLREAHRTPGTLVIDLTKPLPAADNGEWQHAARTGQRPVQKTEAPVSGKFSSTETAPLKRHSKSTELHLRQTPAAVPHPANPYVDSLTRQKNMVLHSSQKDKSKTALICSLATVILVLVVSAVGVLCWISAKTGPSKPVQEIAVERTDNQETVKPAEDKKEGKQNPEFAVEQDNTERKTEEGKQNPDLAAKPEEAERKKEEEEKQKQELAAERKKKKEAIADARKSIEEECSRIWMFAPEKKFYDEQGQSVELMDILLDSEKVVALYIRVDNKDNKCPVNENFCEEQIQDKNPLLSQQSSFNYRFEVKYGHGQEKSGRKRSVTLVNMEKECTLYKIAALRIGAEGLSDRIVPLLYDFQPADEDSEITVKPVLALQKSGDKFTVRLDKGKIVWEYTLRNGETKLPDTRLTLRVCNEEIEKENCTPQIKRNASVLTWVFTIDDKSLRTEIQEEKNAWNRKKCDAYKQYFREIEEKNQQAQKEKKTNNQMIPGWQEWFNQCQDWEKKWKNVVLNDNNKVRWEADYIDKRKRLKRESLNYEEAKKRYFACKEIVEKWKTLDGMSPYIDEKYLATTFEMFLKKKMSVDSKEHDARMKNLKNTLESHRKDQLKKFQHAKYEIMDGGRTIKTLMGE